MVRSQHYSLSTSEWLSMRYSSEHFNKVYVLAFTGLQSIKPTTMKVNKWTDETSTKHSSSSTWAWKGWVFTVQPRPAVRWGGIEHMSLDPDLSNWQCKWEGRDKWTNYVFQCTIVGLESPPLSVSEERQLAILTELPFVVPFEERVKVCRWFLDWLNQCMLTSGIILVWKVSQTKIAPKMSKCLLCFSFCFTY